MDKDIESELDELYLLSEPNSRKAKWQAELGSPEIRQSFICNINIS